jgi:hypothetical protein
MIVRASEPPMKELLSFKDFSNATPSSSIKNRVPFKNGQELPLSAYDMKSSKSAENVNMHFRPLTSAQIRAARSLIRWSAEDLARQSALSVATIRRAELMEEETSMTTANDIAVRRALESAGVEFIDENGGGPGVRLRKPSKSKSGK